MAKSSTTPASNMNILAGAPIMRMALESGTMFDIRTLTHIHNTVCRKVEYQTFIDHDSVAAEGQDAKKKMFLRTVSTYTVRLFGELTRPVKVHGQFETSTLPLLTFEEDFNEIELLSSSTLLDQLSKKQRKLVESRLDTIREFFELERKMEQPEKEGDEVTLKESHIENFEKAVARIERTVSKHNTNLEDEGQGDGEGNVSESTMDGEVIADAFVEGNMPYNVQAFFLEAIWNSMSELGIISLVEDDGEDAPEGERRIASVAINRRPRGNVVEVESDDDDDLEDEDDAPEATDTPEASKDAA